MISKDSAQKEALQFLKDNNTAVVATVFNNVPFASTVYYLVDDQFNFFFITRENTKKYLNLKINNHVALVVGTGPELITIQVQGNAELLNDIEDISKAVEIIFKLVNKDKLRLWPIEELTRLKDKKSALFKVIPTSIFLINISSKKYPLTISKDEMQIFPWKD